MKTRGICLLFMYPTAIPTFDNRILFVSYKGVTEEPLASPPLLDLWEPWSQVLQPTELTQIAPLEPEQQASLPRDERSDSVSTDGSAWGALRGPETQEARATRIARAAQLTRESLNPQATAIAGPTVKSPPTLSLPYTDEERNAGQRPVPQSKAFPQQYTSTGFAFPVKAPPPMLIASEMRPAGEPNQDEVRPEQYPSNFPTQEQILAANFATCLTSPQMPHAQAPGGSCSSSGTEALRWYCITHDIHGPDARCIKCDKWATEARRRLLQETFPAQCTPRSANTDFYINYFNTH